MRLHIDSDLCNVAIEGPDRRTPWTSNDAGTPPSLKVTALNRNLVRVIECDQVNAITDAGREVEVVGVHLDEETTYRVTIAAHDGNDVRVSHQDPAVIRDIRPVRGRPDVLTGNINFRSQIGHSSLTFAGEHGSLVVELEVRPTKLDYDQDFGDLLDGVSELSRQLVLEFLRATTQGRSHVRDTSQKRVEWLALLRDEIAELDRALKYVVEHPRSQLVREVRSLPVHRIRRSSGVTRRAIGRGAGEGPWMSSTVAPRHRSILPTNAADETLNTAEHRWLRQEISNAARTIAAVRSAMLSRRRRATPRSAMVDETLAGLQSTLAKFDVLEPFASARQPIAGHFASLALLGQPGYREAYQSLMRLRMSTAAHGDALQIPVKSLAELYEIWCYLATVSIVSDLLGTVVDPEALFKVEDRGINLRVVPGAQTEVVLNDGHSRVAVSYNREFSMLTGRQRPDIVIEVRRPQLPPVVLLLDAKYRLDTSPDYLEGFGSPGPPVDAIGQLHRYRDAIVVEHAERGLGRPVVRAIALFPLSASDSGAWDGHRLNRSIEQVGIGGLPFLPSNTERVRDWLMDCLTVDDAQLAWPGPEFLAWSAVGQRPRDEGTT